ncbi:hypothetical protein RchiOBHm_Chr1g0344011 [Rosa chinensis]|uniref:Uncharacterized protein n=1 Tax=Rosa chinensis TaxID=74649 RepID=A0A2P6SEE8_ROSCH|nr:hypothetical protein RchiOBHm_Chr1g0344011 [Rosa chinensis]
MEPTAREGYRSSGSFAGEVFWSTISIFSDFHPSLPNPIIQIPFSSLLTTSGHWLGLRHLQRRVLRFVTAVQVVGRLL